MYLGKNIIRVMRPGRKTVSLTEVEIISVVVVFSETAL
jgi:hypothetical protein